MRGHPSSLIPWGLVFLCLVCLCSAIVPAGQRRESSFAYPSRHREANLPSRLIDAIRYWSPFRSKAQKNIWADKPKASHELQSNIARYQNQVVIRFNITSPEDATPLRAAADRLFLDIWDFGSNQTDIRLESRRMKALFSLLPGSFLDRHSILIPDLARAVAATFPSGHFNSESITSNERGITPPKTDPRGASLLSRGGSINDVFFQEYRPLSAIMIWMRLLEDMFRGRSLVHMISIGKSFEGRDIPALRVGIGASPKPTILVTGGLHAREWISTSTVNYLTWSFISLFDKDPLVTKILEKFDIVFVPVLNPDGYEYTWEVDRLWRKSRQPTKMQYCPGLDLDHAFGYRWEGVQPQTDPCSESYGGDQPFEAVEASQLAEWARNETLYGVDFVGFLDLHSYSQQVLYPYSYSCSAFPPNWENLEEVGMNLAKHMRLSNGEVYTVASACEGVVLNKVPGAETGNGTASTRMEAGGGSAIDYFFHEILARYSYQIKLRDTGSYGFLLPSDKIIPTGEETFQAMKYFGDFLLGNNGHEVLGQTSPSAADQEELVGFEGGFELRRRAK